ncbi:dihydrolipoyl dehydrogenase [Buchnera aphidicola]|uniref:Dihydrolipoyl dehydrogenase n=1 Tax=Buchnera aphidicola (Sarucallis kahawaluokalani) TaxID=1241878 RepID=A0A4D6Y8G5_9GAMM|nr:dihydrolipoyl dehydrogenase [Buchnera aphidicola]QCI25947.1 dihydrolipoyl dehydrogenase [Buchnera aphidicola (Sarucallis kahawaluokalani)]
MVRDIYIQVLVIGSGPAGYSAAFRSADLGLSTILVEKYNELGGVCLNVGCIPSKFLLHIAKVIKESKEVSKQGIFFNNPSINFDMLKSQKKNVINNLSAGLKHMAKNRNVKILYGVASFINKKKVLIVNKNEKLYIHFEHVIIATGSRSVKLSNIFDNSAYVWDSTNALSLKTIPKKLLIVGSGIIGLEMATFYSAIGSQVDVIDRFNQILPFLDYDIVKVFVNVIKRDFNILLQTSVKNTCIKNDQVIVTLCDTVNEKEVIYDAVLVAIGRTPNIQDLCLDNIGLHLTTENFIKVDNQFRTNVANIYAIGDVIGQPMLAHKGMHQGHIVAEIIAGNKHYFDPIVIPAVAYTDPEIAWVGIHEKEAIQRNINYEVAIFPWSASGRAIVSNCSQGVTKLIIDKDNRKIIGGIIVGRQAGELLSEITLAIEMGCDIEDIALTIHAHPTLYESIGLTAQMLQGTITDLMNVKSNIKK